MTALFPAAGLTTVTGERVGDFAAFFRDTWPDLQRFCLRATGSPDLADELAQEAMTRVYVRFPLLREPRPYVFRVAANLVRRAWRCPAGPSVVVRAAGARSPAWTNGSRGAQPTREQQAQLRNLLDR